MAKYRALTTIDHDNTRYAEGDDIELSGEAEKQLVALGRVAAVESGGRRRKPAEATEPTPADGEGG